jgi:hypothetical protein
VNQRGRETDSAPGFSCWPKLTALCAYSRPVQGIAECARSAPQFASLCCRRSFHDLLAGRGALACDRLGLRGRYREEFIPAKRVASSTVAALSLASSSDVAGGDGSEPETPTYILYNAFCCSVSSIPPNRSSVPRIP